MGKHSPRMSGVDFGSLPPGARSQWLNEGDRRNHDALYTGDITGAKPGLLSVFVSNRGHNDPLEPKYGLPSVPAPTNPNLHSRTQMPLGSAHARHEPTDINAKRVSAFSCMSETPARDIMRTHDIIGGGRRQTRAVQKGYDSMQVQDINHDGVFKSTRRSESLGTNIHIRSSDPSGVGDSKQQNHVGSEICQTIQISSLKPAIFWVAALMI